MRRPQSFTNARGVNPSGIKIVYEDCEWVVVRS